MQLYGNVSLCSPHGKRSYRRSIKKKRLFRIYRGWTNKQQTEFLDFCTGVKGVKILSDGIFKEVINPETVPQYLNEILSLLLNRKVEIVQVIPNDNSRLAGGSSLLVMDIVVRLEDGSLANIEIQRVGYAFPGQRSACYSADLLLRQYKKVRGETDAGHFSYHDIKNVYVIVFFEKSTYEFHQYPDQYVHFFRQISNTGLILPLLQNYFFIPLDIFKENLHNRGMQNRLDAWLAFFCCYDPEDILGLIRLYPDFKALYEHVYQICRDMENIMGIFSKELRVLDRNTTLYMIDEMQATIDRQKLALAEKDAALSQVLAEKDSALAQKNSALAKKDKRIKELEQQLGLTKR